MSNRFEMVIGLTDMANEFDLNFGLCVKESSRDFETKGESTNEANFILDDEGCPRFPGKDHTTTKDGIPAGLLAAQAAKTGCSGLNPSLDSRQSGRIDVRVTPQLMTILGTILSKKLAADQKQPMTFMASDSAA
jgi:hypothetical protein